MADPKGLSLDTVRSVVKFSSDILQVQGVSLNPIFTAPDPDNYYDNASGTISYAAGIPGGSAKSSYFINIAFLVKKAGDAALALDGQSIILSGGDNILAGVGQPLKITVAQPVLVAPPAAQPVAQPVPAAKKTVPAKAPAAPAKKAQSAPAPEKNNAVAALTPTVVPIVESASSENGNAALGMVPWIVLAAALAAMLLFAHQRKRIFALFVKKPVISGMPPAADAAASNPVPEASLAPQVPEPAQENKLS